jgi:putative spermidine/putrescine transport system permease protein
MATGAKVSELAPRTARSVGGPGSIGWLVLPALLALCALFIAPNFGLLQFSFYQAEPGRLYIPAFTTENYARLLTDPYYLGIFGTTARIGGTVTLVCLVLGYPVAYAMARSGPRMRGALMLLVLSPMFVSNVIRVYGWTLLLSNVGPLNWPLRALGLSPVSMLGTEGAVIVSLVQVLLPFMILSLWAAIQTIPVQIEDAASSLGAGPLRSFREVVLPLSMTGVAAGSLFVFILAIGAYASPVVLGGLRVKMILPEIYTEFMDLFNWPLGSALAMVLLAGSLVVTAVYSGALDRAGAGKSSAR